MIRQKRHGAVYDWEAGTGETDLVALRSAGGRLFAEAYRWLGAERPRLAASLSAPAPGPG